MMEFLGDVLYDLKEFSDTRFEVVALFPDDRGLDLRRADRIGAGDEGAARGT